MDKFCTLTVIATSIVVLCNDDWKNSVDCQLYHHISSYGWINNSIGLNFFWGGGQMLPRIQTTNVIYHGVPLLSPVVHPEVQEFLISLLSGKALSSTMLFFVYASVSGLD